MNYIVENLYPTPIYVSNVKQFVEIQNEFDNIVNQLQFDTKENWGNTHYLSSIDFDSNLFDKYDAEYFKEELDFHLRNYCRELEFKFKRYKTDSWMSMFKNGNYGHIHSHGHVDISGVYYYKTNTEDGDLFFECPVPNIGSSYCYYNKYCQRWVHKPEEGKILLFPGWIKHGITTNKTDNTRISISFNITFDRSI